VLSFAQKDTDCLKSLRTGTFIYPQYGNEVIIRRTKTKQIESFDNGKSKIYMTIEWPSDDLYILTFTKVKGQDKGDMKGHKLYVSITSCNNGIYQYHCKSDIYGDSDSSIKKIK
jgi:hypothetical protein